MKIKLSVTQRTQC